MGTQLYDRLANGCVVTAVASALIFDHLENYHWIACSFGIMASIVAVTIYFYNQWHLQKHL